MDLLVTVSSIAALKFWITRQDQRSEMQVSSESKYLLATRPSDGLEKNAHVEKEKTVELPLKIA